MFFNTVELLIPLLLASLGGLFSEKAGILNISLEGLILSSAFAAFTAAELTGSILAGVLSGILIALLFSLLFALGALGLGGNIYVVGLAVNLAVYPLTDSLSRLFFQQGGALRAEGFTPPLRWGADWAASEGPGGLILGHSFFYPLALVAALAVWAFFRFSQRGWTMELQGLNPERARQKGIRPDRQRLAALLLSGIFCGLAGSALSLSLGSFVPSMSAGKGWIALVVIYLGEKKVGPVFLGALFFALMESMAVEAQGILQIHPNLVLAMPYYLTLAALALKNTFKRQKNSTLKRLINR